MAQTPLSRNKPQNPDPQEDEGSGDDITHPQEQPGPQRGAPLPDRLPKSLLEWLARTLAPAAHLPWRASARECRCQPALPGAQPGEDQRHRLIYQALLRSGGGYEISRLVLLSDRTIQLQKKEKQNEQI